MTGGSGDTATRQAGDTTIAYIPLPLFAGRLCLRHVVPMILIVLIGGAFFAILLRPRTIGASNLLFGVGCGMFAFLIPFVIVIAIILYRSFATRSKPASTNDPLARAFSELEGSVPWLYWNDNYWTWDELNRRTESLGLSLPRTIVDQDLQPKLSLIERPDALLEPEFILPSIPTKHRTMKLMIGFYFLMAVLQAIAGNWWFALLFVLFAAVFVASLPGLREILRNVRWDEGNTIAAVGSVSDKKERRWTTNDAIMLVQTLRGVSALYVSLIGEAGRMVLVFSDENDPDFVKLWQRWNHPRPRPELVVE